MVNGGQNLLGQVHGWRRWHTCLLVAAVASVATWWFAHIQDGFFTVAGYSAIALPSVTVVMCADQFILPRLLGVTRPVAPIPPWRAAAAGNWLAIIAVLTAMAFGAWGQDLIPGQTAPPQLGIVSAEAWVLAGGLYVGLAALVTAVARPNRDGQRGLAGVLLGFARVPASIPAVLEEA